MRSLPPLLVEWLRAADRQWGLPNLAPSQRYLTRLAKRQGLARVRPSGCGRFAPGRWKLTRKGAAAVDRAVEQEAPRLPLPLQTAAIEAVLKSHHW